MQDVAAYRRERKNKLIDRHVGGSSSLHKSVQIYAYISTARQDAKESEEPRAITEIIKQVRH